MFMRFTASLASSDAVTPLILTHFSREAVTALIVARCDFGVKIRFGLAGRKEGLCDGTPLLRADRRAV
jgi:hypothetical protein